MNEATAFITMGDPAGVGPEIICKALVRREGPWPARLAVVGTESVLRRAGQWIGGGPQWIPYEGGAQAAPGAVELVNVSVPGLEEVAVGRESSVCGEAAFRYIERAVQLCQAGVGDGIITAPLNKAALNAAGHHYPGHTEMLAALLGVEDVTMLLATPSLRVAHVSTHCSLREAVERVRPERIVLVARLLGEALRDMGFAQPRIALAGLNPHAGESGLFGTEERQFIVPALQQLRDEGWDARGPEPPDTVFLRAANGAFDGVVAMYHDQGHIAVKMGGLSEGVNVSLGLPIVRTSVDHGTAFDIAGTGVADEGSLVAAIELAAVMVRGRAQQADRGQERANVQ